MTGALTLNQQAMRLADEMAAQADDLRIKLHRVGGARVLDCGIYCAGSLRAGLLLARVCLADRGDVRLVPGDLAGIAHPHVQVMTDDPVRACMASQYAGWQISVGKYFAMGSGPMRAAYGKEALFEHIGGTEKTDVAVGVLETRHLPNEDVIAYLSESLGLAPERITVLAAPTASLAGTFQIVARSAETALHKLHELGYDLSQVISAYGSAPLPNVAQDDLHAIGRTNDAILYGGQAILWVRGDDEALTILGPRVPSSGSNDYGEPFLSVFERYGRDFYKIDRLLFSPAQIVFHNISTGRSHVFGRPAPDVLQRSFYAPE